jgi:hypothetical protein
MSEEATVNPDGRRTTSETPGAGGEEQFQVMLVVYLRKVMEEIVKGTDPALYLLDCCCPGRFCVLLVYLSQKKK